MANRNGMPEFDLTLGTAFKVIERNANPKATEKMTEKMTEKNDNFQTSLSETHRKVFNLISLNPNAKYKDIQKETRLSRGYISKVISDLKE